MAERWAHPEQEAQSAPWSAVRSEAADAGPKESDRGGFRPKESTAWAAKAGAAVEVV
jgi:hypothetical protein